MTDIKLFSLTTDTYKDPYPTFNRMSLLQTQVRVYISKSS